MHSFPVVGGDGQRRVSRLSGTGRAGHVAVLAAALLMLAGCGPKKGEWREVQWDETGLRFQVPCKPKESDKPITLGVLTVPMQMQSCHADGAMYAVASAPLPDLSQVDDALTHWRQSNLQAMGLMEEDGALPAGRTHVPTGALTVPGSLRVQGMGHDRVSDQALHVEALWFAAVRQQQPRIYYAVIYSAEPQPAAAKAFMDGIALP
ncbi:hypothetical protein [Corticibacter populi]|nr:hypothetical protein [Corticibacter populi]RZS35602.1 hypothetical protein EV687_0674 [Corticibacter populi]